MRNWILWFGILSTLMGIETNAVTVAYPGDSIFDFTDGRDLAKFEKSTHTFPGNSAKFDPKNVSWSADENAAQLRVQKEDAGYSSGEMQLPWGIRDVHYGTVEFEAKAACGSGIVNGLFLFRWSPWQEIDIEILGKKPTKIQTSVVHNVGHEGSENNGPNYTPQTFDLGFDACQDYHTYQISWDPAQIRFYADNRLIDTRRSADQGLPYLPLRIYANVWLNEAEHWAGPIDDSILPRGFYVRKIKIQNSRTESPLSIEFTEK